jgi:hypothetical protein
MRPYQIHLRNPATIHPDPETFFETYRTLRRRSNPTGKVKAFERWAAITRLPDYMEWIGARQCGSCRKTPPSW